MIKKAYDFAERAHEGQFRESGERYFNHPCAVAIILIELGMDTESVTAAFLHDVVEDTDVTLEEIRQHFGPDVAMLVNSVTSEGGIPGFYAEYTPERIFGESGCLKIAARMAKTSIYDIPSTAPDYLLQVYSAALDEIPAVPKAVTFRAFNDGKSDRFVTIIAENGHGRIRERVKIAPGEKKSVEILDFEPLGGKRIEKLYIGVEMWNLIGRSDLYVSGLCFE